MEEHWFPWDPLKSSDVGCEVSILVARGTDNHLVIVGSNQFICGDFDQPTGSPAAFHCWKVLAVDDDVVKVERTEHSQIIYLPPPVAGDFLRTVEVCAGLGGTSVGATASGFRPLLAVDRSKLACSLLKQNGMPIVIHGDLHDWRTLARVHLAHASTRYGLIAGFPCQPFSTLGRSLAFQDPRAHTFFKVLDLAFLVQAAFVLLECVVAAGSHVLVQDALSAFCQIRGFRWTSVVLHLDRVLPCNRTRWWCLLIPDWIPEFQISDLPLAANFQTIASVFPFWPCWSRDQELQLVLDADEIEAFSNPAFGTQDRHLNWTGRCPTLLHSMGNQLRECPCGCRGPLSEMLLTSQGLHGVLVASSWPDLGDRHLHPLEAACLVGLPSTLQLGDDLRATLSQIGQIASPFQAQWVLLHLKAQLGLISEEDIEATLIRKVWTHVSNFYQLWTPHDMFLDRQVLLRFPDGTALDLRLHLPTKISHLLAAEYQLGNDWAQSRIECLGLSLLADQWIPAHASTLLLREGFGFGVECLFSQGLNELTMHRFGRHLTECAGLLDVQFLSPFQLSMLLETWPESACQSIGVHCDPELVF